MIRLDSEVKRKAFKIAFNHHIHNDMFGVDDFTIYTHLAKGDDIYSIYSTENVAIPDVFSAWEPQFLAEQIEGLYLSILHEFEEICTN